MLWHQCDIEILISQIQWKSFLLTSNYQFTSSSIVSFVVDDAVGADVVAVVVVVADVTLYLPNTSADPLTASEYSMLPIMAANKIKKKKKRWQ